MSNEPTTIQGMAAIATSAFHGQDLTALWQSLAQRVEANQADAGALFDLSVICQVGGDRDRGLALQREAFNHQRLYRPIPQTSPGQLRLLALMAPGDFMANTPLEFLLQGTDVALDLLYIVPGLPFPAELPDHDLAFMAIGESDETQRLLGVIEPLMKAWPRPVLNAPANVLKLSRLGTWQLLEGTPGLAMARTVQVDRATLEKMAGGEAQALGAALPGTQFPIIARPLGSHAGQGLEKLDDASAVAAYLQQRPEAAFYISPFIDYRSADGQFRKYRVAVIGGRPFASHMAISDYWMVHYLNAGMTESAEKRAEEGRWMDGFDAGFAQRHGAALQAFAARAGLDYFAIDCGETPDGRLLVFEADTAMIVHSMDPPALFPYKAPAMQKLFTAFAGMLHARAGRA